MATTWPEPKSASEHDPFPGLPTNAVDRTLKAGRAKCREIGAPLPPIARPYNGWDRA